MPSTPLACPREHFRVWFAAGKWHAQRHDSPKTMICSAETPDEAMRLVDRRTQNYLALCDNGSRSHGERRARGVRGSLLPGGPNA